MDNRTFLQQRVSKHVRHTKKHLNINDKKEGEHPIYKCLKWNKLLSGELLNLD